MYKWLFFLFSAQLLFAEPYNAVTYEKGSRFGDNLLCYLHAKWLAYQYQMPLLYKPFKYSSELVLHEEEILYRKAIKEKTRALIPLEKEPIDLRSRNSSIYVCPYFPEDPWEKNHYYHFDVDWKDPEFRKIVSEMIAPKKSLSLIKPPPNTVNIAIHVREGGGFDPKSAHLEIPLKIPPLSFYREGLVKILSLFPLKFIHCHVFTDAEHPETIIDALQSDLPPNLSIEFDYRKSNSHDKNVLEDFFSLFNFDILIRPQSNFSLVPSLIHDFAIVYSPTRYSLDGSIVTIDETNMEIDQELYQRLLLKEPPKPGSVSGFGRFKWKNR